MALRAMPGAHIKKGGELLHPLLSIPLRKSYFFFEAFAAFFFFFAILLTSSQSIVDRFDRIVGEFGALGLGRTPSTGRSKLDVARELSANTRCRVKRSNMRCQALFGRKAYLLLDSLFIEML
jgi:hypothetical protein